MLVITGIALSGMLYEPAAGYRKLKKAETSRSDVLLGGSATNISTRVTGGQL